jgi:flagellar hook-associated protein 2
MTVKPAAGSAGIDVSAIVEGLMQIERRPLEKLNSRFEVSQLKVSSIGAFTAALALFQQSLLDLRSPNTSTVNSSNPAVATAQASSGLVAGVYTLEVLQVAKPTIKNVSGFSSEADARSWFSALGLTNVQATYITTVQGAVTVSLRSTATGVNSNFSLDLDSSLTVSSAADGQDAIIKLNGVQITNASNRIDGAVSGLSISLSPDLETNTVVTLTVARDETAGKAKIESFVRSYNDLVDAYRALTKSDPDSRLRGPLSGDSSVAQAMRTVTQGIISAVQTPDGISLQGGLADLGVRFTRLNDGKLEFFPDKPDDDPTGNRWGYNAAIAAETLAKGIRFGVNEGTDLLSRVEEMLAPAGTLRADGTAQLFDGILRERVKAEESVQRDLTKRRLNFEEKLAAIQARYISEYAALDALLFRLNNVSESLKSSLDALTASQKNR